VHKFYGPPETRVAAFGAPEFPAEGSSKLRFEPELAAARVARKHEIER